MAALVGRLFLTCLSSTALIAASPRFARRALFIVATHMHAGDLAAIDAKYDIAVSTAAAALDYIVVDDTPAAQRCVELLRARKLGVATFLLLDKQAHLAQKASEKVSPLKVRHSSAETHVQTFSYSQISPCNQAPTPKPSAHDASTVMSWSCLDSRQRMLRLLQYCYS